MKLRPWLQPDLGCGEELRPLDTEGGAVGREVENKGGVMSPELVEGDCPAWGVAA